MLVPPTLTDSGSPNMEGAGFVTGKPSSKEPMEVLLVAGDCVFAKGDGEKLEDGNGAVAKGDGERLKGGGFDADG